MHSSTACKCSTWFFTSDFPCSARLWTKISSKYARAYARWGLNNCVTRRLNVAGAFDSPWGITSHFQSFPLGVLTAVNGTSHALMSNW
ncbi:hypothetical protein PI125_g24197 [Phytophthora idaei]|nr:hypothetical protein PI125_g24197 [Phytophthora idaei]